MSYCLYWADADVYTQEYKKGILSNECCVLCHVLCHAWHSLKPQNLIAVHQPALSGIEYRIHYIQLKNVISGTN